MIRVAYFIHEYDVVNGSTRSLLNMLEALHEDIMPLIIFPKEGSTVDLFRSEGYICEVVPFITYHLQKDRLLCLRRLKYATIEQFTKRKSIKKLKRIFKKNQIQLVHTNTSVVSIGYQISSIMKLPHIWHLREFIDADFDCYPIYGFKRLKKNIHNSTATISISKAVQSHFQLNGKPNAYQVYNAVVSDKENIVNEEKEKFFMLAGHLLPTKGVQDAIEAFAIFIRKYKLEDYKLVLIGEIDPYYKKELQKVIHLLNIDEKVQFIEYTNQLKDYYNKASAFLMCSKMEGLGRVSIEAMYYGCPVIGFNSGGTAEIIQNSENGFLFNNLYECADLMAKVLSPPVRKYIIENAIQSVNNNFTEKIYRRKVIEIYNALVR